jgi:hypothetical protein
MSKQIIIDRIKVLKEAQSEAKTNKDIMTQAQIEFAIMELERLKTPPPKVTAEDLEVDLNRKALDWVSTQHLNPNNQLEPRIRSQSFKAGYEMAMQELSTHFQQEQPTIETVTNCPTCGAKCSIGNGDGNSHYYIPESNGVLKQEVKVLTDGFDNMREANFNAWKEKHDMEVKKCECETPNPWLTNKNECRDCSGEIYKDYLDKVRWKNESKNQE